MARTDTERRQPALFDTGKAKPRGRWFLAIRKGNGDVIMVQHNTLDDCYTDLERARQEGPIVASEIFGPRAGAYRVIDGDVWDRKPRARKKRGQ